MVGIMVWAIIFLASCDPLEQHTHTTTKQRTGLFDSYRAGYRYGTYPSITIKVNPETGASTCGAACALCTIVLEQILQLWSSYANDNDDDLRGQPFYVFTTMYL